MIIVVISGILKTVILPPTVMRPLVQKGFTAWVQAEIERRKRLKPFLGCRRGGTDIRSSLRFLPLVRFFEIEYQ